MQLHFLLTGYILEKTSVDQYWSKVCGVIFEIIFKHLNNNVSLAQLVECQTVDLEVPGSNPVWGEFFSLKFLLMRK